MLLSLALVLLLGLAIGEIFRKLKLPSLLGMLITGIILGPYCLDLLDGSILGISEDLRKIALIIILARAGLSLNIDDLKKVGRPAVLMCFVPAMFEIAGTVILAPILFGISYIDAAIMGTVLAAVSPAVVVPKMLNIMSEKYGTEKGIPQMILAGASVDDVFVIVLFTVFIGMAQGKDFSAASLLIIPVSLICGIVLGFAFGMVLVKIFKLFHIRDSKKILIIVCVSFLFIVFEKISESVIPFSGLLAVMSMGIVINFKYRVLAERLSDRLSKIWITAEIVLFVLVGAAVNINYSLSFGVLPILLIVAVLVFRMCGVFVSTIKTPLNAKERIFACISYLPKATVQAAIGSIPLSMGLESGNLILTVAVLAIIVTAPLGAIGIEKTYKLFLEKQL